MVRFCEHGNKTLVFINSSKFNHYLRNYQTLNKVSDRLSFIFL
jgi:hypothetical protein